MARTAIYVTGLGNKQFAKIVSESLNKTLPEYVDRPDVFYAVDSFMCNDFGEFAQWSTDNGMAWNNRIGQARFITCPDSQGSINQTWNTCVHAAHRLGYEYAIVLNDDIYLPPKWYESIAAVLDQNPQIALVGIPADGAWHDQNKAKERWFDDPSLFEDQHVYQYSETPVKYQGWTSGPCWATRVAIWRQYATIPSNLFWGYGEPYMGMKLYEAGFLSASIYCPLIWHYGGGAYWDVHGDEMKDKHFNSRAGNDAVNFASMYGTSELQDLHKEWEADFAEKYPELQNTTPAMEVTL